EEKKTNERIAIKQEKEEEKLKKIIAKYIRGNEKKAKIAKDRQKKLARLEQNKVVLERLSKKANFKMEIKEKGDFYPLRVDKITFGYTKDHLLYENISLQMIRGDRFVIVGENGVGKSTLLKLIMGTLNPLKGTIEIGEKISIGYYAQEHETLEEEKTIVEQFESITKDISFLRGVLGRFLFSGDDIYKKVSVLSPGERSRVALAKLALEKSNLLLLDEPTNHLDPDTQSLIAEVFKDYPGTLLVVSHNIEFVKSLNISKMLYLPSGKITDFDPEIIEVYEYLNEQ
ncbi:TPA: ABC-F family ATP-binding cassette domain-containing protein, partial [Candidatus Ventrenecus avicola]|nr:ABC-F family ATP-binding cassette domain-containing protein [Candidatus Ventrenecus avicola]